MYDVTIVGSGVSGIFLAYTLIKNNAETKVLILEKGDEFNNRSCPIETELSKICMHCKICSKTQGFGGMARSEGKYNYTDEFGGNLGKKIGHDSTSGLMSEVDSILCKFGADKIDLYNTRNENLSNIAKQKDCRLLSASVRHLGTKLSSDILEKMYLFIKENVDILFNQDILSINKNNDKFELQTSEKKFISDKVVLATGISGKEAFKNYCNQFNIKANRVRVDLGIRVEMNNTQLDKIFKNTVETKLFYKCDEYEATTYCMNPNGKVIKKYQDGFVMADGQNSKETEDASSNLNFTVFVPRYFDSLKESEEYTKGILESINDGHDRLIVQRLDDLLRNIPTTEDKLKSNTIIPSLTCYSGNLREYLPSVYMDALVKVIELFEHITDKEVCEDTLLYGADAKFYEPEIESNRYFETKETNLYVIGDCSGTTFSLAQAAASGIYLGKNIFNI